MYLLGIDIYNSPCEGDFLIADLYKKGLVNACLTDDSDSLPNGCGVVLRNFTFRTNEITEIKLTDLLKELEFTQDNVEVLMKNSPDFDSWVTEMVGDLENFTNSK